MAAIIVTVLNEGKTIQSLLDALSTQSLKAKEIIIVDGGSSDNTREIVHKYPKIKLLQKNGNRSVGRNFGVANSKSEIIAFTDAGCIPHRDWLEKLVKPFLQNNADVVSGFYEGQAKNVFEKCLIPYVLVMPDQIKDEFLPATRSMAITRSMWNKSGGFDEKLSHNEDYAFSRKLKNLGADIVFAKEAVVTWIPRKDLKSAAWMFLRFAIGDAQAGIIRPKVKILALRYYLFFFSLFINPLFGLLLIPYLVWAVVKNFRYVKELGALYWLPILQVTADIMVLFGTVVGLLSRLS